MGELHTSTSRDVDVELELDLDLAPPPRARTAAHCASPRAVTPGSCSRASFSIVATSRALFVLSACRITYTSIVVAPSSSSHRRRRHPLPSASFMHSDFHSFMH
jgi:hypothetical protein